MKRQILQEIREDSVSVLEEADVAEAEATIEDVVNRILAEEGTCTYAQAKAAVIADRILADLSSSMLVADVPQSIRS